MATDLTYDVVVVGGGHSGVEASLASARMLQRTLLLTMDPEAIGRMSCNPAIGGTAKGHLVREIDALGGEMGKIADATGIHFRMLNRSKGPAIWSPRCQNDREWYSKEAKRRIDHQEGLDVLNDTLQDIELEGRSVRLAITGGGRRIECRAVVVCTGTFLDAVMHTGLEASEGGRYGEAPSKGLSGRLRSLGFRTARLKTGTPPRLDRRTIDFESTERQDPDAIPVPFSFQNRKIVNRQIPMHLTWTNPRTHEKLREGFDRSPMFTGRIKGIGPRYCPSIEDKISRFADRERHQIFLEPEGYESEVVYVNGFSTSLPAEVQLVAIRTVPGLEEARMIRPGYAVEYDFFPPHQLEHSLESKLIKGLFFAGQVNGTSGYEEAAGQGLVAGVNAALHARGEDPFIPLRNESYLGVMIDDLINKGTEEPYRMFTSRAEYRLLLRQDNADSRLMRDGHRLGLIPPGVLARLDVKERMISDLIEALSEIRLRPEEANGYLLEVGSAPLDGPEAIVQLLRRPGVRLARLLDLTDEVRNDPRIVPTLADTDVLERTEIDAKYEGYLKRQAEDIDRFLRLEMEEIPAAFDFESIQALSAEGRERLELVRPRTIGQASRISGVTPSDVSVLMIYMKR